MISIFEKIRKTDKRILSAIIAGCIIVIALIIFIILSLTGDGDGNFKDNEATTAKGVSSDNDSTTSAAPELSGGEPFTTVTYEEDKEDPQSYTQNHNNGSGAAVNLDEMSNTSECIGIDVSRYQGTIDWKQVAAAGIDFAMIRAGYRTTISGEICEDPYAAYNITNALANGINVGVYFFSSATDTAEAKAEADWTADFISGYSITYPVAYNCENYNDSENRQFSLTKAERSDIACAFLDSIAARGYTPMFYASKSELENNAQWNISDISSHGRVWAAWYPSVPYPDTPKSSYSGVHHMWQYTNNGSISGINAPVDINVSYLGITSKPSGENNNTPEDITVSPEANMNFQNVNQTVTAKIEVNLRSTPSQDTDSTVIASIKNGEPITRTGISDSGWSRLLYNGRICYAVSSYLTTDLTPADTSLPETSGEDVTTMRNQFTEVNEAVTPKEEVNLRSLPSVSDSEIIATVKNGDILTKTGVSDLGWARVSYNGQTLYCIDSYLTSAE